MTNEVLVKVRGLQMTDDDSDVIETIAPGSYFFKNGKHYILYDEMQEGFDEPTKNRIKITPGYMELQKKGVTSVHMIFEEDKKNVTCYYTPYGSLQVGIEASLVELIEEEEKMNINVKYALELNGAPVAESHITIEVLSAGSKLELD